MQAKLTANFLKKLDPKDKMFEVYDTEFKNLNVRVQPSGRKVFYYTYRMKGSSKRQRINLGVFPGVTVDQARELALDHASDVAKGINVQKEKTQMGQGTLATKYPTFLVYIDDYYTDWTAKNHKSHKDTIQTLKSADFKPFLSLPLHDITYEKVEKWQIQQKKKGLAASTINRKTATLRGALSRAVDLGLINNHPLKKLKDLKIDKAPIIRYLSQDETKRLFEALESRDQELKEARERGNKHREKRGYSLLPVLIYSSFADRMTPLITISLKTGMRQGEVFDLEWKHVNFDQKTITIVGHKAKSGNTRHIPMSPAVYDTLKSWEEQSPKTADNRVFPADDLEGGKINDIRKSWANLLERAQITNFRWHDMRHDFASQLVMKGVPLNTVRELCGHASLDTTQRYAHLAPDHKAEAVALLD